MISKIVTPSTAKKGMPCTQRQVSFASDTLFSQVSAAALDTTGNNPSNKDDNIGPRIDKSINHGTGRNSNKNQLEHWQDQIQEEEEAANHNIILCSFKDDGPLTKTCIDLNLGENMVMEAKVSNQINKKFMEDMSPHEWILESFGNQPAPFPFLANNSADNTAVVLHGIQKFITPFGYSHKNGDDTIMFLNNAKGNRGFPKSVKLDEDDFEVACKVSHPNISAIMDL